MDRKTSFSVRPVSFGWLVKMAWRDSRKNRTKLALFITSISLGIAALVGITSFRENLLQEINNQARTLIGADLEIRGNIPLPDSLFLDLYQKVPEISRETYFASMVYFPRTDGTRLVQVRALSGSYPYYGEIETDPLDAGTQFKTGPFAVVDEKLMIQYNVEIGDSVRVGKQSFKIIGKLRKIPGQTGIGAMAAPVVYIPYSYTDATELLKKGSRVNYLNYVQYNDSDTTGLGSLLARMDKAGFDVTDVEARKEDTGRAFKDLTNFLQLVSFIALLLGCIGVAGSMYVYSKEKIGVVATLRCLGLKSKDAIMVFLIQVCFFGFLGSVAGSMLGAGLNLYLPLMLQEFVPVTLQTSLSVPGILLGISIGIVVSVLFSLISLVSLRKVSPLQAIRSDVEQGRSRFDPLQWGIGGVTFLLITLMVYVQIGSVRDAFIFTGILVGATLVLGVIAKGLTLGIRKLLPERLPYVWRQGLSNLYRPHNQTTLLVITLGLGTAFIATLFFLQDLLVGRVTIAGADERPNTVLFDIQTPQREEVKQLTLDYDLPVIQEVPIVTMRLLEMNGISKLEAERDTSLQIPDWAYNREYRITYREDLIDSETIAEGEWIGKWNGGKDTIFISVAKGFAENLHLNLGDEMIFNVQGATIKTYIGSFRDIDWNRVQTNFLVLFPTGVLEKAPQFHVLITRIQNTEVSARYQQAVVRSYPNISIIDLELILKTLEDILGKVAFVIRFMALFSIGTGVLMLISSIVLSRYQRIRENVLLRTLGASGTQLWKISVSEYFFLGAIGAVTGLLLAVIFTILLSQLVYDFPFIPDWKSMLLILTGVTMLTTLIGLLNSRSVLTTSPLEILRRES